MRTDFDMVNRKCGGCQLRIYKNRDKNWNKTSYLEYEILSNLCVGIIIWEEALTQMAVHDKTMVAKLAAKTADKTSNCRLQY